MPRFPRSEAGFVLLLVWESACQKRQVSVPVPTPPAKTQPASPAAASGAAGSQPANPATTTQPEQQNPYQVNKPPQPTPAVKKPARSAAAPASTAPPAPTPAATAPAPAAPPPKLGDVLTPDEQRQYSAAIDQSLAHAQTSLNSIGGQQLNKEQQAELEQIQGFMQRARATRESDPAGAKSLSQRAEVLARDLAASFH
jgi:hypothetical protein